MEQETTATPLDAGFRQQVFGSIRDALPRVLGRDVPGLCDATQLMAGLGLRSATMLELLLELEEDLGVQIDVEEIDTGDMSTVGDLADFVAGHTVADS